MPKLTYETTGGPRSVEIAESCSIGKLAGNTIVLADEAAASRHHCQILKIPGGYELSDLGSTNGTKVNGERVKRAKLKNGDRIEIGKTVLQFADAAAAEEEISLEEPAGAAAPAAPAAGARQAGGSSEQCYLVFAGGEKDGQKVLLDKPRITFGRNAKNAVQLNDAGASGFHAEIAREGGTYVLRDLGSTNGTLVDGEPVSETALSHGARIRMGNTRLVFVDPSVSDFEKAMSAVEDLGSEWGMLRAEMDMDRVQRARRSQAVALVLAVVAIGGAGYVAIAHPEVFGSSKPPLKEVAGNKVQNFSFEQPIGTDWSARAGTPTKFRVADAKDGPANQGTQYLAVTREAGASGQAAAVQSGGASFVFAVAPGRPVTFGAWVKTTGGAQAFVRVAWNEKPDGTGREVGRTATAATQSSDWQKVETSAMPPEDARAARLELGNAGTGTAFFDDVFLLPGETAGGTSIKNDPIGVTVTADGQIRIERGGERLLAAGTVVANAMTGAAIDEPTRRGDRVGGQSAAVSGAGNSVKLGGRVVDPDTGNAVPFDVTVTVSGGRYVDISGANLPKDAGLVFALPKDFVQSGVGVRTDAFRRLAEPHLVEHVHDVIFGGQHAFQAVAGEGSAGFRLALYKVEDGYEIGFGAADGKLALRLDTDTAALGQEVDKLRADAETAIRERHFGVAIAKLSKLASLLPAGQQEAADADAKAQKLQKDGRDALESSKARIADAVTFKDEQDLRAAQSAASDLGTTYAENEVGGAADGLAKSAGVSLAEIAKANAERAATPLLAKAADFRKNKMPLLAREFYGEVVRRFPGTEAEKKAKDALAQLQ